MPNWIIEYFETPSGRCPVPVYDFIEELPLEIQGKIRNAFRLLGEFGPQIGLPHLKSIKNYRPLYEIRILGSSSIRLICAIDHQNFLILHGFRKKTNKIPTKELKTALKRLT